MKLILEIAGVLQDSPRMKIALGSDHAGFAYKEEVKKLLESLGHEVRDFGTYSDAPVDYPVFIRPAARAVASGECDRAIVFGGSGNGEAIVANKVRGIRCALCFSLDTARWAREHNDANALAIGQRTVSLELALEIVRIWLTTDFTAGRHLARVQTIEPEQY
jgi:ribose 5-phosphate isomerase B